MKPLIYISLIIAIISLLLAVGSYVRISSLTKEVEVLKGENEKLSATLEDIKKSPMFRAQQMPLRSRATTVSENMDHKKGDMGAPVTLIEFCDYQSQLCRKFHTEDMPALEKEYIDTGKVRYVYKDFANVKDAHSQSALRVANAVRCAGEQGKFWEMHELIYQSPGSLEIQEISNISKEIGLNSEEFEKCLSENRYISAIQSDFEEGRNFAISVTPSFLIGYTDDSGEIKVNYIRGARSLDNLRNHIDKYLNYSEQ